jgi:large subunit ribosomal protein L32e
MTEPETPTALKAQKVKVKLRKRVKANKPKFQGQEVWRYKRIRDRWRRPRGVDSKMRQNVKGWPKTVNVGCGGPKTAKFLHPSGYKEVLVRNLSEIEGLDAETQAIRIAHAVGGKKRMEILTKAKEKRLHILNPHELKEAKEETMAETTETKKEKEETAETVEAEAEDETAIEKEITEKETG